MVPRVSRVAVALLLFGTLHTPAAHADSILIHSGSLGFDTGDPTSFSLTGDDFQIFGFVPRFGFSGPLACVGSGACTPGATVDLSSVFGGPDAGFDLGRGVAIIGGTQYGTFPSAIGLYLAGTFAFDAPALPVPSDGSLSPRLTAPFLFTGQVAGYEDESRTGAPLFDVNLHGRGQARLALVAEQGGYSFLALTYDFESAEPIPEPATLLIVGSGVAGLVARQRMKRRRVS